MKPSASQASPSGTGAELRLRVDRIDQMRPIGSPSTIFSIRPITMKVMPSAELALPARRVDLPAELVHHLATSAPAAPAIACGKNAM